MTVPPFLILDERERKIGPKTPGIRKLMISYVPSYLLTDGTCCKNSEHKPYAKWDIVVAINWLASRLDRVSVGVNAMPGTEIRPKPASTTLSGLTRHLRGNGSSLHRPKLLQLALHLLQFELEQELPHPQATYRTYHHQHCYPDLDRQCLQLRAMSVAACILRR